MKIKQFAESRGVTRQAVYSAIKKNGLQTGQLVDSSGNLTDEGIATLDGFFPSETVNRQADKLQNTICHQQATIDRLTGIVDAQQKELEKLPENLREAAAVRLENPDVPLKRLGELMDPPIGKSGMNHRLANISRIAQEMREKEGR